jgi:hypothetical protein
MKRHLLILSAITLLLTAGSAYAQSVNLKANVPFDFIVNGRTMPAGPYAVRSLLVGSGMTALQLQNTDSKASVIILPGRTEAKAVPEQSKLVFHRYGANCFLRQIFTAGNAAGRELPKSHWESEVARDYTSQDVILAADLK